MSRDGYSWHIEKLMSRKHGHKSLLRVIEMKGASQTGRYGVYEYDQREKPNYTGFPRHRIFTMQANDRFRLRQLKLIEGDKMPDTLTLQQCSPGCLDGIEPAGFAEAVDHMSKLEALACRVAGGFINNGKFFMVRQADPMTESSATKVFTAELLVAMTQCFYTVAAYKKTVSPDLSQVPYLKLLPYYNAKGQLVSFSFDIDFEALKSRECIPQKMTLVVAYARLAQQLVNCSKEMTLEGYLSDDKATKPDDTIERYAIQAMAGTLRAGRNPVQSSTPPELNMFYRHQRFKQFVLFSCQHLLEYFSDFHFGLQQLSVPGQSMKAFYGFFNLVLPKEVMQQAYAKKMQELSPSMCRLIARRDSITDDAQLRAESADLLSPDLAEIVAVKEQLVALQFSINQIQIEIKSRGPFQPTAVTDYFYCEKRMQLMALVESWQMMDPELTSYISTHNVFADPFDPASGRVVAPVVSREEGVMLPPSGVSESPAVSFEEGVDLSALSVSPLSASAGVVGDEEGSSMAATIGSK
ncbi:MAG: hypothetical protein P1U34_06225 [Coxiellaceae bacterium]|nr:hypothetical protein [Coxiellaceae bacterium]